MFKLPELRPYELRGAGHAQSPHLTGRALPGSARGSPSSGTLGGWREWRGRTWARARMTGQHLHGRGHGSLARQKEAPRRPRSSDATAGCPKPQMSRGQGGRPGRLLGKRQASPHRSASGAQRLTNKDGQPMSLEPLPWCSAQGPGLSPRPQAPMPHGPKAGSLLGLAPRTSPLWCSAGASRTRPQPLDQGPLDSAAGQRCQSRPCSLCCPTAGSGQGSLGGHTELQDEAPGSPPASALPSFLGRSEPRHSSVHSRQVRRYQRPVSCDQTLPGASDAASATRDTDGTGLWKCGAGDPQGPGAWAQPPGRQAARCEPSVTRDTAFQPRALFTPNRGRLALGAAPNLTLPTRVLRVLAGEATWGVSSGEISGWRGVCGSHMGGGAHYPANRMESLWVGTGAPGRPGHPNTEQPELLDRGGRPLLPLPCPRRYAR